MKDIEYGLFAQVAYYNWVNYEETEPNISKIFKEPLFMQYLLQGKPTYFQEQNEVVEGELTDGSEYTIYKTEDKRLLMMYSEDKIDPDNNKMYKNLFEDWELIEGSNHEKIYKETLREALYVIPSTTEGISVGSNNSNRVVKNTYKKVLKNRSSIGIDKKDSGFQAVAFKKKNKVIISYRGTDFSAPIFADGSKEFRRDMFDTNLPIFFNKSPDQVLCTVYFYEKVKKMYPNKDIYITGHSLGGGLAQFAALYGGSHPKQTVTWNALGIPEDFKTFCKEKLFADDLFIFESKITKVFKKEKYIDEGKKWLSKDFDIDSLRGALLEINETHPDRIIYLAKIFKRINSNYDFFNEIKEDWREVLETEGDNPSVLGIFLKNKEKNKMIHYYFGEDIVRPISSKSGVSVNVNTFEDSKEDKRSFKSIIVNGIKYNSSWHSINNFLPFFNLSGMIEPDRISEGFYKNTFKSIFATKLDKDLVIGWTEDSNGQRKSIKETKEKLITELLLNRNRKNINFILKGLDKKFRLKGEVGEEFELEKIPYDIEGDEIVFGSFANYDILAGVLGGEEIRLDLIDILKNQHPDGRKIDYISENLLRNEFKKNELNFMIKEGGYNFFSSVVETMHTKDLKIFDLAEKALKQTDDDVRVYLEMAIEEAIPSGEIKERYVSKESWEPSNKSTLEKLYEQAKKKGKRFGGSNKQVNTPKSEKFYKSFLDEVADEESTRVIEDSAIDERNRVARLDEKRGRNTEQFIGGKVIEDRGSGFREYARTSNSGNADIRKV